MTVWLKTSSSAAVVHRRAAVLHLPVSRITNLQAKEMLNNIDIILTSFTLRSVEKDCGRENPDAE
jgi:hypothetical protein